VAAARSGCRAVGAAARVTPRGRPAVLAGRLFGPADMAGRLVGAADMAGRTVGST